MTEPEARALLEAVAQHLDSTCNVCKGAGFKVEPACCNQPSNSGECCGQPIPKQAQCDDWFHYIAQEIRAFNVTPFVQKPQEEDGKSLVLARRQATQLAELGGKNEQHA